MRSEKKSKGQKTNNNVIDPKVGQNLLKPGPLINVEHVLYSFLFLLLSLFVLGISFLSPPCDSQEDEKSQQAARAKSDEACPPSE